MSAVPKKKLCWNCDGNVSREIDNCPYCGVYLHAEEMETGSIWNPFYQGSAKTEEIPAPPYQIPPKEIQEHVEEQIVEKNETTNINLLIVLKQLKQDLFPILFLMMGSVFFLFGIVLILFSHNGALTLQWSERSGYYFLLFAFPLIGFGWNFLQRLESKD